MRARGWARRVVITARRWSGGLMVGTRGWTWRMVVGTWRAGVRFAHRNAHFRRGRRGFFNFGISRGGNQ